MVSPAPATFAERRSILQVLEQYGPVDVFKKSPVSLFYKQQLKDLVLVAGLRVESAFSRKPSLTKRFSTTGTTLQLHIRYARRIHGTKAD
jgi:hypothetical protein